MAARRSTQLIIIGVSVFVIGAGLVFLGLRSNDDKKTAAPPAATAPSTGAKIIVQGQTPHSAPVVIPKGMEAVAVKLDRVAGLAGYAKPGDLLNLFATVKGGTKVRGLEPPYAKLILGRVPVLDVTGVTPAGDAGEPTYLLGVSAAAAERLIFFARFESLWATLVPPSGVPSGTAGRDYSNALSR
jgi:Flp pilus assembly protein RcpC/CpaB